MATNYPTSLDTFTNPAATDQTNAGTGHAKKHTDAQDAIAAIEAKVGIAGSAVTTSVDYRLGVLEGSTVPGQWRILAGRLYLKNPNTSLWRELVPVANEDGKITFDISQTDVS